MAGHQLTHKQVNTNGISLHVVEKGEGPSVLLLHGFPETWFSWKYQIDHLANNGYRVIAPDMRGYGDSDSPQDPTSYTTFHLVGDLIGLLDNFGVDQTFVVGHDWGAQVAWNLCLLRPDRIKALVNLGVPYFPRSPELKPTHIFKTLFGEGLYLLQFQEAGRAERTFAKYDCLTILKKFWSINTDLLVAPPGIEIIDFLKTPSPLPSWITEEDLQFMATQFAKSGFTGPFNYYRAKDLNWELQAPWQGAKITVPTKFIVGDKDIGSQSFGTKDYVQGSEFRKLVPNLEVVIIDGHHFIQWENAKEVTDEIISYFNGHI